MCRRVLGITLDNLDELPSQCRQCVFWELAPHVRDQAEDFGQTEVEKEAWISSVLLEWGSCGRLVRMRDVPAGYALYAPPAAVPRCAAFPTAPVNADAVLLTALKVLPDFGGHGLGRLLVREVATDLARRGVHAVEAFGDAAPVERSTCVIPAAFLQAVGFTTVAPHPRWPRLRLELHSGMAWKEDVEAALEQLLASVSVSTVGARAR